MRLRLINARIWDGRADDYLGADSVLIEDGEIRALGERASADETIDLGGRALLPGFIDAHYHAYADAVNVALTEALPLSYLAHHAARMLKDSLRRGFTTVRDAGGAEWGLWRALESGLIDGPRLFYSGRALSQTGGHGDTRAPHAEPCGCGHIGNLSEVVDGADNVRRFAREALRRGAHQIKLFVSGGVVSPTDPIWMRQYSAEEIAAAVEEARTRRTYVMAHAYTPEAILHAVENGVRSIEHGNLLNEEAAAAMAARGAYLTPTLVTYQALADEGAALGLPVVSQQKLRDVIDAGAEAVRIARRAGVRVGFGTDLLGPLHARQLDEFRIRGAFEAPLDVLRAATSVNAALLNQEGVLGVIAPGAAADLVAVEGDPLADLAAIWKDGPARVFKAGRQVT